MVDQELLSTGERRPDLLALDEACVGIEGLARLEIRPDSVERVGATIDANDGKQTGVLSTP